MIKKILINTTIIIFFFSSVSFACEIGRWIAGRCYIKSTGKPLIGVTITITDITDPNPDLWITKEAKSGLIIIDGEPYNLDSDIFIPTANGWYVINFGCDLSVLFGEIFRYLDGHLFNIDAEAEFADGDGNEYIKVTGQYTGKKVMCGTVFVANFEYELQTPELQTPELQTPQTAILLSEFYAEAGNRSVTLNWETSDETDNFGFNIYRHEESGELVKINDSIIYAKGGEGIGANYEFVDDDVRNRTEYTYLLEDVDIYGAKSMHEPVSATPLLIYELIK